MLKKRMGAKVEHCINWWKMKKEDCCEGFRKMLTQALGGPDELLDDWISTATVIREGREVFIGSSGQKMDDKY